MLTKQFFTRVQLAKLLGFKSVGMLQRFEKKGFLTPDIKPSKYSFNQTLLMLICKELVDFTNITWQDLMDTNIDNIAQNNILDYNILVVFKYIESDVCYFQLKNEVNFSEQLQQYLDTVLLDALSKLNGRENSTYENIPSLTITTNDNYSAILVSINRIYRKLQNKCTELKINLEEKVTA